MPRCRIVKRKGDGNSLATARPDPPGARIESAGILSHLREPLRMPLAASPLAINNQTQKEDGERIVGIDT